MRTIMIRLPNVASLTVRLPGLAALLTMTLLAMISASCSPAYIVHAAIEEAKILSRRRPISEVLENARTDSSTRRKLELVLQARSYADHELRLETGESFTTYSWVDSDTLLMVVSAARKDRFEQHTWWFPIVGHVPYKGYFDFDQAYEAAAELEKKGYDAYVRPSGAFSTLGWFNDPLLNTVLRYGDVSLAATVIHELLHNTIYVPSQAAFNESFANFVGDRGAIAFWCNRESEENPSCQLARAAWSDNLVYSTFLGELIKNLEALYARPDLGADDRIRMRETVYQQARERFTTHVRPQLKTTAFNGFAEEPLNNATLIATRLYYDRLALFEAAYQRHGGDLQASIAWIIQLARANTGDPFRALAAALEPGTR